MSRPRSLEATGPRSPSWSRAGEALLLFVTGRTARAAVPVALVVGTVLSSVNQGAILLSNSATAATYVRIAVNVVVPYCVASYGFLMACRVRRD